MTMPSYLVSSSAHELVDGDYDFSQLRPGDAAIPIDVIQFERPPEFLVNGSSQQRRQCNQQVLQRIRQLVKSEG